MSKVLDEFRPLFYPKSVAVVGASKNPLKMGHRVLEALLSCDYKGTIYLVNPYLEGDLLGLSVYPSIDALPTKVDLCIYAIQAKLVIETLRDSIERYCKAAVVLAAGFRDAGKEGAKLQEQLKNIAKESCAKIIGPNCAGILNRNFDLNATIVPKLSSLRKGNVAVVSQSGGVGNATLYQFMKANVGVSKFVSIGNQACVDFADILQYLAVDPETHVIALWIEGMERARKFYNLAKQLTEKPILAYTVGATEAARRAAFCHTGLLFNSAEILKVALKQAGILQVDSVEDIAVTAKALLLCPSPERNAVVILTFTAGPSIIIAGILEKAGINLVSLSNESKKKLRELSPLVPPVSNPVDMVGILVDSYPKATEIVLSDENVSCALIAYTPEPAFPPDKLASIVKEHGKPVIVYAHGPFSGFQKLKKQTIPFYDSPEQAATALVNLIKYHKLKSRTTHIKPENY